MSISLMGIMVGLPLTLAMRAIMGKEKFEEWAASTEYILYTDFERVEQIRPYVISAGYDFQEWHGSMKTHLNQNQSSYFLWKEKNGKIVASMSIYDDKNSIAQFTKKVEQAAKRKIFYEEIKDTVKTTNISQMQKNEKIKKSVKERVEEFPTIYVDKEILEKILLQYQINIISVEENRMECQYRNYKMYFTRETAEEAFNLRIISTNADMRKIYDCIHMLDDEYYANVQEQTYLNIKEQILEEGMEIEEEQILEDNSIVLTVVV